MSIVNQRKIETIRTSVHFIRNYFDTQAPNTPPPSPLPNINLFCQSNNNKKSKFDRIADELIDMYSIETNNIQILHNKITQLTMERDQLSRDATLLKQQLIDCEQSTQQMICHYVSQLEKERLQTKKWMSLATKQEQLVSTLEKKEKNNQLTSQIQANELEDKQKLLHHLIDERQILLKRINTKTSPLFLKPLSSSTASITKSSSLSSALPSSYYKLTPPTTPVTLKSLSSSKTQRSSIDLLEQMAKTDLIMYPLTPIRRVKTDTSSLNHRPPPSPPPPIPLPKLPSSSSSTPLISTTSSPAPPAPPPPPPYHHCNSNKQLFYRSQPPLPKSSVIRKKKGHFT